MFGSFSKHRLANPRQIPAGRETWMYKWLAINWMLNQIFLWEMVGYPNIHYQPSLAEVLFLGVLPWLRSLADDGSFVKGGVSTLLLSLKDPLNPFSNLFDKLVGFQR